MRLKNRSGQDLRLQLLALYLLLVVPIFVVALFFFYDASQRLRADTVRSTEEHVFSKGRISPTTERPIVFL